MKVCTQPRYYIIADHKKHRERGVTERKEGLAVARGREAKHTGHPG